MTTAYIALGSSMGDRKKTIDAAILELGGLDGVTVTKRSSVINTVPEGVVAQNTFLNCALEIETTLAPLELLEQALAIEESLGRTRILKWEDRVIDIDIILFGDLVMDEPRLTIPHPLFRERAFVLRPLAEIAPRVKDPVTEKTIAELLEAC